MRSAVAVSSQSHQRRSRRAAAPRGSAAGAPLHPHRGFDTVMYLKQGEGRHSDSTGNSGVLRAGDVQWMTAASGIEHDEGRDHPGGVLHGFQLWVNLPAKHKMDPPAYQDVPSRAIPVVQAAPGVSAKVIAGECAGVKAVVQTKVAVHYVEFVAQPGSGFTHALPAELATVFCYVTSGSGVFGPEAAPKAAAEGDMLVMSAEGDTVRFSVPPAADKPLAFLLLAGAPIREPIVRHGPFVMNTRAEIQTCFAEYQAGTFIKHKGTMATF